MRSLETGTGKQMSAAATLTGQHEMPEADAAVVPGGSRSSDPPLTVKDFATYIGKSSDYVRKAIRAGELEAANLPSAAGRPSYSLELRACIAFLKARGYTDGKLAYLERIAARHDTAA